MATTTNFGWETPDDTDLVKDGALAIRTLGSAIDTSLVDLKGGTTGQVLSKTSNTDMDFTWVTSDDANAIQNAIVDAKGDLIAASAADTPARLAVGNNGETLVADSSATTGLRWQGSQAAGKNAIINGAFDIWQRSTSAAMAAGSYVAADRWYTYRSVAGSTFSRQTASLTGFQYSGRVARDSGNTSTTTIAIGQSIESVNSIPFAGQTVVLSFWAKAGANYSAASSILRVRLLSSTTTDQNIVLAGGTTVIDQNATLTTSWQRFSYSAAVGSTAVTIGTIFSYDPVGTAGAADNFEVTGVQVELGTVATPFTRAGGTLAGELAAACRYYYRLQGGTNTAIPSYAIGVALSTTKIRSYIHLPAIMRTVPSVSYSGTLYFEGGATTVTVSSIGQTYGNSTSSTLMQDWNTTGATSGNAYTGWPAQATTNYIEYSSEL